MRRVTLLLSGVPNFITIRDLSYNLDLLFNTNEIATFNIRDLPNHPRTNKRQIALDFRSGYDAMAAQEKLEGYTYELENGREYTLHAKINKSEEYMCSESPEHGSSRWYEVDCLALAVTPNVSDEEMYRAHARLDAQLQLVRKQKLVLEQQEELLNKRQRLKRKYGSMLSVQLTCDSDTEASTPNRSRSTSQDRPSSKYPWSRSRRSPSMESGYILPKIEWNDERTKTRELRSHYREYSSSHGYSRDRRTSSRERRDHRYRVSRHRQRSRSNERLRYRKSPSRDCSVRTRSRSREWIVHSREPWSRDRRSNSGELMNSRRSRSRSTIPYRRSDWNNRDRRLRSPVRISNQQATMPQSPQGSPYEWSDDSSKPVIPIDNNHNADIKNNKVHINVENDANNTAKEAYMKENETENTENIKDNERKEVDNYNSEILKAKKSAPRAHVLSKDVMILVAIEIDVIMDKNNIRISTSNKVLLLKILEALVRGRLESIAGVKKNDDNEVLKKYKMQYPMECDLKMFKQMLDEIFQSEMKEPEATVTVSSESDKTDKNNVVDVEVLNVDSGSTEQQCNTNNITPLGVTPVESIDDAPLIKKEPKNERIIDIDSAVQSVPLQSQSVIVIKYLVKNMNKVIRTNKLGGEIKFAELKCVLQHILSDMLKGYGFLGTEEIIRKFREVYPIENDEQFVRNIIKDISDGKYPDIPGKYFADIRVEKNYCVHCKNLGHRVPECQYFLAQGVQMRRNIAKQRRLCYICLGRHVAKVCAYPHACGLCGETHHTLLCNRIGGSELPPSKGSSLPPAQSRAQTDQEYVPCTCQSKFTNYNFVVLVEKKYCAYCKNPGHRVPECQKFLAQEVQARCRIAKKNQWCFICFDRHFVRDCTHPQECGSCFNMHHSILCTNRIGESELPPLKGPGPPPAWRQAQTDQGYVPCTCQYKFTNNNFPNVGVDNRTIQHVPNNCYDKEFLNEWPGLKQTYGSTVSHSYEYAAPDTLQRQHGQYVEVPVQLTCDAETEASTPNRSRSMTQDLLSSEHPRSTGSIDSGYILPQIEWYDERTKTRKLKSHSGENSRSYGYSRDRRSSSRELRDHGYPVSRHWEQKSRSVDSSNASTPIDNKDKADINNKEIRIKVENDANKTGIEADMKENKTDGTKEVKDNKWKDDNIRKAEKSASRLQALSKDVMITVAIEVDEIMDKDKIWISASNKVTLIKILEALVRERLKPIAEIENNEDNEVLQKYKMQYPMDNDLKLIKQMLDEIIITEMRESEAKITVSSEGDKTDKNNVVDVEVLDVGSESSVQQEKEKRTSLDHTIQNLESKESQDIPQNNKTNQSNEDLKFKDDTSASKEENDNNLKVTAITIVTSLNELIAKTTANVTEKDVTIDEIKKEMEIEEESELDDSSLNLDNGPRVTSITIMTSDAELFSLGNEDRKEVKEIKKETDIYYDAEDILVNDIERAFDDVNFGNIQNESIDQNCEDRNNFGTIVCKPERFSERQCVG